MEAATSHHTVRLGYLLHIPLLMQILDYESRIIVPKTEYRNSTIAFLLYYFSLSRNQESSMQLRDFGDVASSDSIRIWFRVVELFDEILEVRFVDFL